MNDKLYRVLLDLCMVNDPWPLENEPQRIIEMALNDEAIRRGMTDWIEAYHEFIPEEEEDK